MRQGQQADLILEIASAAGAPGVPGESAPQSLAAWAPPEWPVGEGWQGAIDQFLAGAAGRRLAGFVQERLADGAVIYPLQPFRALALTPLDAVRVVILGQDPYHGPRQAEGLAFSVAPGVRPPPSLRNIFKELQRDLGLPPPADGSLVRWAAQGVLLLNTSLTVEDGQAGSHAKQGWEVLTDEIIQLVAQKKGPVVFMLWGAHAQAKAGLVAGLGNPVDSHHLVLCANHPSPLSALRAPQPFIGCGHFGLANAFLRRQGRPAVAW